MILFGTSLSPFARKVLVFAKEKGIDIDLRFTGGGQPDPQFVAASPFGKMPALVDGDFRLADSSAIVHYLEAKSPTPTLIPTDAEGRGRAVWFDEFADTILFDCGRKMFFNRIVSPTFFKRDGDLAAADKAELEELPPILDYLEKVVPGAGEYLIGDRLTLADIAVASPFVNLIHLEYQIDAGRHARVQAYVDAILARASFAGLIEGEKAFLAQARA